jgi:hypothetical protein
MDIRAELVRREDRLKAIAAAKVKIEARAAERQAAEQAEYEAKRAKREAVKAEGKSPRGPEPKPPESGVRDNAQINLTDEESRIRWISTPVDPKPYRETTQRFGPFAFLCVLSAYPYCLGTHADRCAPSGPGDF